MQRRKGPILLTFHRLQFLALNLKLFSREGERDCNLLLHQKSTNKIPPFNPRGRRHIVLNHVISCVCAFVLFVLCEIWWAGIFYQSAEGSRVTRVSYRDPHVTSNPRINNEPLLSDRPRDVQGGSVLFVEEGVRLSSTHPFSTKQSSLTLTRRIISRVTISSNNLLFMRKPDFFCCLFY